MISDKRQASEWWNSLEQNDRIAILKKYYPKAAFVTKLRMVKMWKAESTDQPVQQETESKHTSGPWKLQGPKVNEDFGGQPYWTILPDPYKSSADPYKAIGFYYPYSGLSTEEMKANAEIISSAPQILAINRELIKTLEEITHQFKQLNTSYNKYSEYIGKAEATLKKANPNYKP